MIKNSYLTKKSDANTSLYSVNQGRTWYSSLEYAREVEARHEELRKREELARSGVPIG